MTAVLWDTAGPLALITLNAPPVNALRHAVRVAFLAALERAWADPGIHGVVWMGGGEVFCAGADIREFGGPQALASPHLHDLIDALENAPKPVVAAWHGVCLGGGLELSLACHHRVAAPPTRVGLPEIKLGLIPGAGGTQRLPRALGVEAALNLMLSGEPLTAQQLFEVPGQRLIDRLLPRPTPDAFRDAVIEASRQFLKAHPTGPLPRVRDWPASHPQAEAFFDFARRVVEPMSAHYPAPLRLIDAVQAATQTTFETGLAQERAAFFELLATPESQALRQAFFERKAPSGVTP